MNTLVLGEVAPKHSTGPAWSGCDCNHPDTHSKFNIYLRPAACLPQLSQLSPLSPVNGLGAMTSNSSPSFLQRVGQLFSRPAPQRYGNGRNDSAADPKALKVGIRQELASQEKRIPEDLHLLIDALSLKAHGGYDDDSKYIVLPLQK